MQHTAPSGLSQHPFVLRSSVNKKRFTVASQTTEGVSAESEPSVAVRPNEPLPEGWKEKFNAVTGKVWVVGISWRFHPHAPDDPVATMSRAQTPHKGI